MNESQSVESCLAELREMFPKHMVDIQLRTGPNAMYARVDVWSLNLMFEAPTLPECTVKARARLRGVKEEQS